jgi:hypothetical protein
MMMKSIKLAAIGVALAAAGVARVDAGSTTIGSPADGSNIHGTSTKIVFDTELAQKADQEKKSEEEKKTDQEKNAALQKAADEANDRSVTISSPANKSKIPGTGTKMVFDVVPAAAVAAVPAASKADHVHVYVDGDRVAQLHELKGSYAVDKLVPGKHWLCIRVVDKAETPVGLEKCVEVNAGNVPPMGYTHKSVSFIEPKDGVIVTSPFKVVFGVKGMAVEPAGEVKADSGHHHLLVNLGPMNAGEAIPVDAAHLHFGKAQTEVEIKLPPGNYELTMQFANGAHVSYGPAMAASINVTVK